MAQTQPIPMDVGAMSKGTPNKGGKGAKGGGQRSNQTPQRCPRCGTTDHTSGNCLHFHKTCRKCGNVGHLASACRSSATAQHNVKGGGRQDTTMVGAVGSYFDLGSVSEGIPELRGAGAKIASVVVPSVYEGETVDIDIDSTQHVWRSPRCGGWRRTARGRCQDSGVGSWRCEVML